MTAVHERLARCALRGVSEIARPTQLAPRNVSGAERVRVDGKFLTRGSLRFRAQGVTYGPFAPNAAGEPFPSPSQSRDDFARMAAAGVNSVRTYHVPPEWFLAEADQG